ncbi:RdgB/HAM1 family non-canonical purine NTP pyrophosphatase [Sphingomonas sp. ID1715]|uniref:RdgB/HAM1 family non-canonical purine NTP pyrophosphatase n=1 Tax=Sphingomonas sp. ID1715 TaxID=1656898 RepID=UPI001489D636|nr:RdgB/HAM1 family non-canonical purine NTP pyrophosphatase [Sphingomonas sp. ID1715]
MTRRLEAGRLVVASHNEGKVHELRVLLEPYGLELVSAKELDLPEPEETGTTFFFNAELKARSAADLSGLPAISDDSGICVEALGGEPGVYTANWAETDGGRDWMLAMSRVQERLEALGPGVSRAAYFACVLCVVWPDGHVESFEGRAEGSLVWPPRGERGFGYDPVFVPQGYDQTFGEMDPEEKHRISHRAAAFAKLKAALL